MEEIKLRKATLDDMENVFRLSNDPEVRKVSINKESIAWEDHIKWFSRKIKDENVMFLVAYTDKISFLGQVRFDIEEDRAIITYHLMKKFRGQGIGEGLLRAVIKFFDSSCQVKNIYAYIQSDNIPSIKIFLRAGFVHSGNEIKEGVMFHKYYFVLAPEKLI